MVSEGQCWQGDVSCSTPIGDITSTAMTALGASSGACPTGSYTTNCDATEGMDASGCSFTFDVFAISAEACPTVPEVPTDTDISDITGDITGDEGGMGDMGDYFDLDLGDATVPVDAAGDLIYSTNEAGEIELPIDMEGLPINPLGEDGNPMLSEDQYQQILDAYNNFETGTEEFDPSTFTGLDGVNMDEIMNMLPTMPSGDFELGVNNKGEIVNPTDASGNTIIPEDVFEIMEEAASMEMDLETEGVICFDQSISLGSDGANMSCQDYLDANPSGCNNAVASTACPESCNSVPASCSNSDAANDNGSSASSVAVVFSLVAAAFRL